MAYVTVVIATINVRITFQVIYRRAGAHRMGTGVGGQGYRGRLGQG